MINEGSIRIYIQIKDLLVETCLWLVVSVELQLSLAPFGVSSKMSFRQPLLVIFPYSPWRFGYPTSVVFLLLQGRALAERYTLGHLVLSNEAPFGVSSEIKMETLNVRDFGLSTLIRLQT